MTETMRYQLWIVLVASLIFFTNLGATALWDMDEALYGTCGREMLERGDWVVPWFNGHMFPEKPPLMFWAMIAGYELFGVNELGARFFSAVFGVLTALAAFHLGRVLCNARVGFWTGLVTATTVIFTISARAATVDSALTLATTLAFLFFVLAGRETRRGMAWLELALMYACIGVTVLGKGPVGMVLPLAAMGLYLLLTDGWRNVLRSAWAMRPLTGMFVIAVVALPWYVWVGFRTDGEWLRRFFVDFNLRPFKQPILGHGDGDTYFLNRTLALLVSVSYYFYHVPALLVGFFPWSILLGPTIVDVVRRIRQHDAWRNGTLLGVCWLVVWLVFWSVCKTKLPHYLLPAYPALALLTACFIDRWQTEPEEVARWWLWNAWFFMVLAGIGIVLAIPVAAARYLHGEEALGQLGFILVVGGAWGLWKMFRGRAWDSLTTLATIAVVFLTTTFAFAAIRVDRYQNARPMIAAIREDAGIGTSDPTPPIVAYRFFRESTVYYAGHPILFCEYGQEPEVSPMEQLKQYLATTPHAYIITTAELEPEVQNTMSGKLRVVLRQPRFLHHSEMVVLRAD